MISIDYIENKLSNQLKKCNLTEKACVLIPIIQDNSGQLSLLFQVRSPLLKRQPNDICFPGGRMEHIDQTPIDTALRETHEELGININTIKIFGQLPSFRSAIGFKIYPVVGQLTCLDFALNYSEVADVFTVPIDWFITHPPLKSHKQIAVKPAIDFPFHLIPNQTNKWQIQSHYEVYFYRYQHYTIWGLTAQIVRSFINTICN